MLSHNCIVHVPRLSWAERCKNGSDLPVRTEAPSAMPSHAMPDEHLPSQWTRAVRTSQNAVPANFGELPFRNCLENRTRSRIRTPNVTKRGPWNPDQPLPGADEARPRGPRLFSKQFLQVLG